MILIVEDDFNLCGSMERMFRYAGYDVVSTPTPSEALSLLHIRRPEAIILDLNLPAMDGITLLKAIRADRAFARVPVLIYTADFSESNQALAFAAGAQDYVIKGTIGWEGLLHRLEDTIKRAESQLKRAN